MILPTQRFEMVMEEGIPLFWQSLWHAIFKRTDNTSYVNLTFLDINWGETILLSKKLSKKSSNV